MPNWCNNSFTVSHKDPAMITKFADALLAGNLFETFVPLTTDDGEWDYFKASTMWGSKWDASQADVSIDPDGKSCHGFFYTAWCPAIEAYTHMETEHGFEIDLIYHESGLSFAGRYHNQTDYSVEYNFDNKDWREDISDPDVLDFLEYEYEIWIEQLDELREVE